MIIFSYTYINMVLNPLRRRTLRRRAAKLTLAVAGLAALCAASFAMRERLGDLSPALERPDVLAMMGVGVIVWIAGGPETAAPDAL